MIAIDLEITGFDPNRNSIWQIGAVDIENPKNFFFGECRIMDSENIPKKNEKIIGKTEKWLKDLNRESEEELIKRFFKWVAEREGKMIVSHNTADYNFLEVKSNKHHLKFPFHYRIIDTHTLGFLKYYQINGKLKFNEGHSTLGLSNILDFCGIPDKRKKVRNGKIIKNGSEHNALEDAKLAAEVFFRIFYGKNL